MRLWLISGHGSQSCNLRGRARSLLSLQAQRDFAEAVERRLQILDDFGGNLVGGRQEVGVVERVVLEPEDVEVDLVASDEVGMREAPEAVGLGPLAPPPRFVAGDKIVEIGA